MTGLLAATEDLVETLRAGGVRVTMDSRNLNLPTVLVVPPVFVGDSNLGGLATFTLYLVTRGPANLDAWKSLDLLLDQVVSLVDVREIRPTSYDVEGTGGSPALEVTHDITLDW
jgi:hypothetical protein